LTRQHPLLAFPEETRVTPFPLSHLTHMADCFLLHSCGVKFFCSMRTPPTALRRLSWICCLTVHSGSSPNIAHLLNKALPQFMHINTSCDEMEPQQGLHAPEQRLGRSSTWIRQQLVFICGETPLVPGYRDPTVPVTQCNGLCHVTLVTTAPRVVQLCRIN